MVLKGREDDLVHVYLILTIFLLILLAALTFYVFYKVRKIHLGMHELEGIIPRSFDNLFVQLQTFIGLTTELEIKKSLPAMRGWAASPDFLAGIANYAIEANPMTIVECSSGVSTLILARCMQIQGKGHVYSLEHSRAYSEKTRQNLIRHGLEGWATVIYAPLTSCTINDNEYLWYSLRDLTVERIDMLVVDGPPLKTCCFARYPAVPLLHKKFSKRFALYLDDAARDDEKRIIEMWSNEFNDLKSEYRNYEKGCSILYRWEN